MNFPDQPLLTLGQEIALSRRIHGSDPADSTAARNELVLASLRLAAKAAAFAARHYRGDYDDYFSEACIGLTDAAQGFKEHHGKRFEGYAMIVMINHLRHFARSSAKSVPSLSVHAGRLDETPEVGVPSALEVLIGNESIGRVTAALAALPKLHAWVIINRFGLAQRRVMSRAQLARFLALPRERIARLETIALDQLRRELGSESRRACA